MLVCVYSHRRLIVVLEIVEMIGCVGLVATLVTALQNEGKTGKVTVEAHTKKARINLQKPTSSCGYLQKFSALLPSLKK